MARSWTVVFFIIVILVFFFMSREYSGMVQKIARAIANAEGFGADANNLPTRTNNPGDLKAGDVGFGTDGGKTIYGTVQDGWNALYHQVNLMLTGASRFYNPEMSIAEIAEEYTGGDNSDTWANDVAQHLGVTVDTQLKDII